jgi:TPR repeat protein
LLDYLAARIDWNLVNMQLDDSLPKRSVAVCIWLINLPVNGLFVAMKTFRIHLLMLLLPLVGFCICAFGQAIEASKYQDSLDIIKKRANAGVPYYMAAYAEVLRRGEYVVSIDQDAALKWARKSAADGPALGKYNVWAI